MTTTIHDVIAALEAMPVCKKPIYWTDQQDVRSSWVTQNLGAMSHLARVCGAVSLSAENLDETAWDYAMSIKSRDKCRLSFNCWPFGRSQVPKNAKPDTEGGWATKELLYIKGWAADLAARCKAEGVKPDVLIVDFERWRTAFKKVSQVHQILSDAFPETTQEWYCNERMSLGGKGWYRDSYGTEHLPINSACCNLYTLEQFYENMGSLKQTRDESFARYLVPFVGIGWHYRRTWGMQGKQPIVMDVLDEVNAPPSWATYTAGMWLVKKDYDEPWYCGNSDIPHVIMYPAPGSFVKGDPNEGMTWWRSAVQFLTGTHEGILGEAWR